MTARFDPSWWDDRDAFDKGFATWLCKYEDCDGQGAIFIGPGEAQNYASIECVTCGRWQAWMPWQKSKAELKRRRSPVKITKLGEDRCMVCGLTRLELAELGRSLQVHHIIDRADLIDAGLPADTRDILGWICNRDHEIATALRRDDDRRLALAAACSAVEGEATGIEQPFLRGHDAR